MQEKFLSMIHSISATPKLTENRLYKLIKEEIGKNKNFVKETKDNAHQLLGDKLINTTMTIIEAFDRINEITTDVEERIYLERIYHKVITELNKK